MTELNQLCHQAFTFRIVISIWSFNLELYSGLYESLIREMLLLYTGPSSSTSDLRTAILVTDFLLQARFKQLSRSSMMLFFLRITTQSSIILFLNFRRTLSKHVISRTDLSLKLLETLSISSSYGTKTDFVGVSTLDDTAVMLYSSDGLLLSTSRLMSYLMIDRTFSCVWSQSVCNALDAPCLDQVSSVWLGLRI